MGCTQSAQQVVFFAPAAANHHGQAFELRVAKQFDRRIKRVHVEVGNAPFEGRSRCFGVVHKLKAKNVNYSGKVPGNKMLLSTESICVRPQNAMVKSSSL